MAIILIDGKLVHLMFKPGVGVKVRATYLLHAIDHDYYEREGRYRGANVWECVSGTGFHWTRQRLHA